MISNNDQRILGLGPIVALGMLLASCQSKAGTQTRAPGQRCTDDLLAQDQAFAARAQVVGASEAFAEIWADDGLMLSANSEPIVGPHQVRNEFKFPANLDLVWWPQLAQVAKSGDLGWTWGRSEIREKSGKVLAQGKYITIWTCTPAGKWRVRADLGDSKPLGTTTKPGESLPDEAVEF
jgi:ketosteroid isomerase-like protein